MLVLPAMGVPPCSDEPGRSHDRLPFQVQISVYREVSDILSDEVRGPARKRELDEDVVALVAQVWSQSKADRRRDTDERDEVKDCLDLIGREPEPCTLLWSSQGILVLSVDDGDVRESALWRP